MFNTNIKKRVMTVIRDRIAEAQKLHDEELAALEKKHEEDKKILESKQNLEKNQVTESTVENLIKSFAKK